MFDPVNVDTSLKNVHESVFIAPTATVIGDVTIGANSSIWYGTVVRADLDAVVIGERTNVQDNCVIHVDRDAPTHIGDDVVIGHGAIVHCSHVGKDTLIGMGSKLLSGCDIGSECIIAAGALVTESRRIPPRSLVMGMPAKVVREVTDEDLKRTHRINAHYLEMAQRYVRGAFPPPWLR